MGTKPLTAIILIAIFIGISIIFIIDEDLTQTSIDNIIILGVVLLAIWLRFNKTIADTARSRAWLLENLDQKNKATCAICGNKLSYHRKPKNINQLLWGGLTCQNCGAEIDVDLDDFKP